MRLLLNLCKQTPFPRQSYLCYHSIKKMRTLTTKTIPKFDPPVVPCPKSPSELDDYDLNHNTAMSSVARLLKSTNHYRFGFPIFRTSYRARDDDEGVWKAYLEQIDHSAMESLELEGRKERLGPFWDCPVIEDRKNLDGASKNQVRDYFKEWVKNVSDERDGQGALEMAKEEAPQYQFCVMVDEECLDSFRQAEKDEKGEAAAIYIEKDWYLGKYKGHHKPEWTDGEVHLQGLEEGEEPPGIEDLRLFEEIDGCREPVVGWMFVRLRTIAGLYDDMIYVDGFYSQYTRPPVVHPDMEDQLGRDLWKY